MKYLKLFENFDTRLFDEIKLTDIDPKKVNDVDSYERFIHDFELVGKSESEIKTIYYEWIENRFNYTKDKISEYLHPDNTIKIWRTMRVDDDWVMNPNKTLGVYWAYDEEGASDYWAYNSNGNNHEQNPDKQKELTIHSEVYENQVDWINTFYANMDYLNGDDEYEIRTYQKIPLKIISITSEFDESLTNKILNKIYLT